MKRILFFVSALFCGLNLYSQSYEIKFSSCDNFNWEAVDGQIANGQKIVIRPEDARGNSESIYINQISDASITGSPKEIFNVKAEAGKGLFVSHLKDAQVPSHIDVDSSIYRAYKDEIESKKLQEGAAWKILIKKIDDSTVELVFTLIEKRYSGSIRRYVFCSDTVDLQPYSQEVRFTKRYTLGKQYLFLREESRAVNDTVPIAGSIPIFGRLFHSKGLSRQCKVYALEISALK